MISASIRGLQEAQRANLRHIASLKPGGSLEAAIQIGTVAAERYNVAITHVDTGALRAAKRAKVEGVRGMVFVDPAAENPRTGAHPADYALAEEARGGSHAAFGRTVAEQSLSIGRSMGVVYSRGLR